MRILNQITITLLVLFFTMCGPVGKTDGVNKKQESSAARNVTQAGLKKAYFASGCFWCVEAIFESVIGVREVVSGYSGGKTENPTYKLIGTGKTGHSEAVEVIYDPKIISFSTLIEVFYGSHNPTTVNGQHPDYGSQYRSMIYYQDQEEEKIAKDFKQALEDSGDYSKPIATEIVAFEKFWPAEDYHQDYEKLNPNQPYIKSVSIPRLKKFQRKFPHLIKKEH